MKYRKDNNAACLNGTKPGNAPRRFDWWDSVPAFERELIRTFMKMVKGAKRSQSSEVAAVAAEWERDFRAFITLRLKNRHNRQRRHKRYRKVVIPGADGMNPATN